MNEPARSEALAVIARALGLETLETRKSDSLDFHEHAIWEIKKALQAAYDAGYVAAMGNKQTGVRRGS